MERTLTATEDGVKRATKAFTALGITQVVFAEKRLGCSRTPVSNFFNQKPVDRKIFTQICETLKLEWSEIAEMAEEGTMESVISNVTKKINSTDNQIRLAFAIAGTVDQVDHAKLKAIVQLLRKITGDTSIEIVDIQEGSIKLILTGTPAALEMIQTLYRSGELTKVERIPIDYINFENLQRANLSGFNLSGFNLSRASFVRCDLSKTNLTETNFSGAKLCSTNFNGADLTGANLTGADLTGANIRRADLTGANLTRANLTRANLIGANLSAADLSAADLSGANLSGANLIEVDFSGAIVEATKFISSQGISEEMKRNLIFRGAIFDDVQGDESRILIPSSR